MRGSARGSRTKWRSFWAWREVEEEVVATVNGVGGDEPRSVVRERGIQGRGRTRRVKERTRGLRGDVQGLQGIEGLLGKHDVAGARWPHAPAPTGRRLGTVVSWLGLSHSVGPPGEWASK